MMEELTKFVIRFYSLNLNHLIYVLLNIYLNIIQTFLHLTYILNLYNNIYTFLVVKGGGGRTNMRFLSYYPHHATQCRNHAN